MKRSVKSLTRNRRPQLYKVEIISVSLLKNWSKQLLEIEMMSIPVYNMFHCSSSMTICMYVLFFLLLTNHSGNVTSSCKTVTVSKKRGKRKK